tara:strand:+ start:371 stop:556 length:186 start_codon:yes stop_codon:yes gene_type:complete
MKNTRTVVEAIEELTNEIGGTSLGEQRCDFTGWSITECLSNLVYEVKRSNELREQFLKTTK